MFSKSFIVPIFLLALTSTVDAHALITPALGVKGNGARSDVQRPSGASLCGNVNILQNLDTSTPIQAAADGTFLPSITDFNG
jgi:phage gp45-like